jgi:hypothetical protein
MKVALIGFQQSGKSTLLAAVSGKHPAAAGSQALEEAVVPVPDERISWLNQLYRPKKTTYATIDCLDVPGLSFLDDSSRAASRRLIGQVRTVDMFVLVARAFANDSVPPYKAQVNAVRDVVALQQELLLTDLEFVVTRVEKLEKQVQKPTKTQQQDQAELVIQRKIQTVLEQGKPAHTAELNEQERDAARIFGLLTMRPIMVVVNVGEEELKSDLKLDGAADGSIPVVSLSARIESELAQLDGTSRSEFMEALGISQPAAHRFVQGCYQALGLISFLTVGEDEVRAWPIKANSTALDAAAKIHTDIKRGFIRAETMSFEQLQAYGDEKALKAAGKMRLEGKSYVVQDGDIINFRFNI